MATKSKKNPHAAKVAQLLAKHMKLSTKGRELFKASGELLDQALAFGAPIGEPIRLRGGLTVILEDQFAAKNTAFSAKKFDRFRVAQWKEPKPPKADKAAATATPHAEVEA